MTTWVHKVAVAFDMAFGVTAGINYDITISTYVGLVRAGHESPKWAWQRPVCVWLANNLDRLEAGHCESARIADIERARDCMTYLLQRG